MTLFTASQLSTALGVTRQAVAKRLDGVKPDGAQPVQGAMVKAWKVTSLPSNLKDELLERALRDGFNSAEEFVTHARPWRLDVALKDFAPEEHQAAEKWREALSIVFNRPDLPESERVTIGCETHRKLFGRAEAISHGYFRQIVKRTRDRAGNSTDFSNIELYFPDNPRLNVAVDLSLVPEDFRVLGELISGWSNPHTTEQEATMWDRAFRQIEGVEGGPLRKRYARKLRESLWDATKGNLTKNPNALRVLLDTKYKRWVAGGRTIAALLDRRCQVNKKAEPFDEASVRAIAFYTHKNCGDRTSQGLREVGQMLDRIVLDSEVAAALQRKHATKYSFNHRLAQAVTREVRLLATRDTVPSLRRDWTTTWSMEIVTADDFTFPVIFHTRDGKGGYALTRGQCLLFMDARSMRIIYWVILPTKSYNSLAIRSLMNRVCMRFGIPRAWYFENGMWRKAAVVKGFMPGWKRAIDDGDLKSRWESIGCGFVHAREAQGKPLIERVGGLLQDQMERYPGYCGRNERVDCPPETTRNKYLIEECGRDPHGLFFSYEEWEAEFARIVERYNAAVQDGEVLAGHSPNQMFQARWNHNDPPGVFDAASWLLNCHCRQEVYLKDKAFKATIHGKTVYYFNEHTAAAQFSRVIFFLDPENPEYVVMTDPDERNPRLIPAHQQLAPLEAYADDPSRFNAEMAKRESHRTFKKQRYHAAKTDFEMVFRSTLTDRRAKHLAKAAVEVVALRRGFEQQQAEAETQRNTTASLAAEARAAGIDVTALNPDTRMVSAGIKRRLRAAEIAKKEKEIT